MGPMFFLFFFYNFLVNRTSLTWLQIHSVIMTTFTYPVDIGSDMARSFLFFDWLDRIVLDFGFQDIFCYKHFQKTFGYNP